MKNQIETVAYSKIQHINVFFNNIVYRNFHTHKEMEFLCLINGTATVNLYNRSIHAEAGSVIPVNYNEPHEIQANQSADFIIIQLSNHIFSEYFPQIETVYFQSQDLTETLSEQEKTALWQEIYRLSESYLFSPSLFELTCINAVTGLMKTLFDRCLPHFYTQQQYESNLQTVGTLDRLFRYISENYRQKISLAEFSEKAGYTPSYLSHFFKNKVGITFQEYVNNLRFEQAMRMIAKTEDSLYSIALECGFSDVKYMNRMFLKRLGCTPKEYRRRVRDNRAPEPIMKERFYSETRYSAADAALLLDRYVKPLVFPDTHCKRSS